MDLMHFITHFLLLLFIVGSCRWCLTTGKPAISFVDSYVDSVESVADAYFLQSLRDARLRRLRRGYYFVEDGFITAVPVSAVPAHRRQDTAVDESPLVGYKETHAKRKKLFVPNLFG